MNEYSLHSICSALALPLSLADALAPLGVHTAQQLLLCDVAPLLARLGDSVDARALARLFLSILFFFFKKNKHIVNTIYSFTSIDAVIERLHRVSCTSHRVGEHFVRA